VISSVLLLLSLRWSVVGVGGWVAAGVVVRRADKHIVHLQAPRGRQVVVVGDARRAVLGAVDG
jgi:hypothetical protein